MHMRSLHKHQADWINWLGERPPSVLDHMPIALASDLVVERLRRRNGPMLNRDVETG
jgi:hypothetical protein